MAVVVVVVEVGVRFVRVNCLLVLFGKCCCFSCCLSHTSFPHIPDLVFVLVFLGV